MEEEKPLRRERSRVRAQASSKTKDGHGSNIIPDDVPSSLTRWVGANNRTCKGNGKVRKYNEFDVLAVKGGAAQTVTHPGNLFFYQLCEDRYDAWSISTGPNRSIFVTEILDAITAKGGVFLKRTRGQLPRGVALEKIRDRMRQIGKPKVRPLGGGFGVEDVVFATGGANHFYPGNAKWRALLDVFVPSYHRDVLHELNLKFPDHPNKPTPLESQRNVRIVMRCEVVDEIIRIIHSRGGKFRDRWLQELSVVKVRAKTHSKFKDIKKELINGTRKWIDFSDSVVVKEEQGCTAAADDVSTSSAAKSGGEDVDAEVQHSLNAAVKPEVIFTKRSDGFTSVKAVISIGTKRLKNLNACGIKGKGVSSDDDSSLISAMLDSDSSGDSSGEEEEEEQDCSVHGEAENDPSYVTPKRIDKKQQDNERNQRSQERSERRKRGILTPKPCLEKKKRRRKGNKYGCSSSVSPPSEHPLSEYELLRLKKIQRNEAKLAELGLLTSGGKFG
mmetsp:Transcript_11524/g.20726  ORF Transcript_11524/g.20726 Transcript_11524/m.20726 type:complete len:501 (+) Transcript_11524:98-1600(+)|eukprot:CAMPEP_0201646482 /NCGR_PEP_ID=MMETSP0493-20130528/34004_1 /ASSEMBLY_ACC=CAM_ASM_000838 /TAXON_ID=420259 /ORGANISM="Thalassiosira gravida, Strain GMp14c1" /LENGTH=500 /DNA_ID=CAMNT_0048121647 /DNA_START=72 /DNA_END=1574 /DNA_ORIENTATION=-